jgi:hypothetical protein
MRKAAEDAVLQQIAKRSGELGLNSPVLSQFNTAAMATNQGEQASTLLNLDNNTYTLVNDGDPHDYTQRGPSVIRHYDPSYANPMPEHGSGARRTFPAKNSLIYNANRYMDSLGY